MGQDAEQTARTFTEVCRRVEVAVAFEGALAAEHWGLPQRTQRIEALVSLAPMDVRTFVDALRAEGFNTCASDFQMSFEEPSHVTVSGGPLPVQVRVAVAGEERETIREAKEVTLSGGTIPIVRAEEIIAFKLALGTREDLQDAAKLLAKRQPSLDLERLHALADRKGVADLLESMLVRR